MNKGPTLNNLLKISALVGILLVAVSMSYYFLFFLPNKEMKIIEIQKIEQENNKIKLENESKKEEMKIEIEREKIEEQQRQWEVEQLQKAIKEDQRQEEVYRKECIVEYDNAVEEYEDFINTCVGQGGNTIDYCIDSSAGQLLYPGKISDSIPVCMERKKQRGY